MTDERPYYEGYVSLFSGGGFGDIGIEGGSGLPLLACSELLSDRVDVLKRLFPNALVHPGDIWETKDTVVRSVLERTEGLSPRLLIMSPPCQGMSSNGVGRISAAMKRGQRPKIDPRNSLILPGLEVVEQLTPECVIIENVKHMARTTIANEHGEAENIVDIVRRRLPEYRVEPMIVNAAHYGVPQRRERLITVCRRRDASDSEDGPPLHAPPSHTDDTAVTLREATAHLSPLDADTCRADPSDLLHCVPRWKPAQLFCMAHTPEGGCAFDNTRCACCGVENLDLKRVRCKSCGKLLPRPIARVRERYCSTCDMWLGAKRTACDRDHPLPEPVERERLVRAFKTAYRRMEYDRPAATLTTNSGVISSDVKGHPVENRVLSVREVLIAASLCGASVPWSNALRTVESLPHTLIRHIAGESIPPLLTMRLVEHLLNYSSDTRSNR